MKHETNDTQLSREDAEQSLATPFFARFLEVQREGDETTTNNLTLKYPSDRDEDIDWAV